MSGALFIYGTLRHRPLLDALTGGTDGAVAREGWLPGHRVVRQADDIEPVLVADAGARAPGMVWTGLSRDARELIDAWEAYEPGTVTVEVDGETAEAVTYLPPPDVPSSGEDWALDEWVTAEAAAATLAVQELAAHDPRLAPAEVRRQKAMIRHRASAALRARAGAPARVRQEGGRFAWRRARPVAGEFFRLDGIEVDHARFDGTEARGLRREVLVGADAALVLPYDAARDRVLLVEQFRTGPMRRGDPRPWTLEPVAGLIDAGETPEAAARREGEEEAGLAFRELVPMFNGYASPGNATDHFYAYLGLCDLPDDHATFGGLASEQEDLRLHVLPAEEAVALVDTGEANAVPLVAMLLWLDRWRRGSRRLASGAGGA